jgi:hypothetical protein
MGQFFRVNGDYNIKTKGGGTITFDTGIDPITLDPGNVNIVGNLSVTGDLTSVSSSNLEIVDRILVLNKGEDTGNAGVSLIYSGIEINRAASDSAAFVWDENSDSWIIATGSNDDDLTVNTNNYSFNNSNLKIRRILTDASTDNGDLTLIGTGSGVVKVAGTTNYRLQVTDNDDIPNKDYVDYSILNNPTFQIRAPQNQDTRVIIADKDITPNNASTGGSLAFYQASTGYPIAYDEANESGIGFLVDGVLTSTFYRNRVVLQSLEIVDSEIRHDSSNENIFINTNGTGKLQTNYGIQLDNNAVSPAIVSGSHVIYSKPQSTGKSGIYFVNTENTRDELVSKNRALLFSMLF